MITVRVPTLSELTPGYDQMFQLWQQVNGDDCDVTFDFSGCVFLRQSAVAFLGGLARLIEYRGGSVRFNWDSLPNDIRMNLAQNGFLQAFGVAVSPWGGNSIPYREDPRQNPDLIVEHLANKWLGRGWVQLSPQLRDGILSRVLEIYTNAFEHSRSPIGVFSCGQHYPKLKKLGLTAVDFGVGIPSNVRVFKNNMNITAQSAMEWAFQRGTTTRPGGAGGGLGLDLLKALVKANKGRLDILSHEGHAAIIGDLEFYDTRSIFFEGTLVTISLRCDANYYMLASEVRDQRLF